MAERKPLFQSAEGYQEEMAQADSITLGALTMGGEIDMGDNQISNVPTPTDPDHAVNKAYVDALAQGLDPHESVIAKTTAELTSYVAAGSGVGKTLEAPDSGVGHNTIDGTLLEVGDRVLVSMQGGDDATADADNGVYTVTILGDGASALFKMTRATDCDEASDTEFHQGTYVFVTAGTTYENTGWTCATDVVTVDTTANKWTQFSGAPGFTYDQGLVKSVSSIQVELDTDADAATTGAGGGSSGLEFDVDSAAGQLRVRVDPAGGIDRNAAGIGIDLDGTTLQLDNGGAGSGISVKGLPSSFEVNGVATTGANLTAANLDTLVGGVASDADALHTHNGLAPSVHTHAHSATTGQTANDHHNQQHAIDGSDHTATGLTTGHVMTATGATTFAFQALSAIDEAKRIENTIATAVDTVAVADPVYINGDETVGKARADDPTKSRVIGLIRSGAGAAPQNVEVVESGLCLGVLTGATPGVPYYLGATGGITATAPAGGGNRIVLLGYAYSDTDLMVRITDYGRKAA